METLLLKNTTEDIQKAAEILQDGGLVAMPTETVYGLAADALNGEAVSRIFAAKGRPMDNPLIVHVADFSDIERLNLVKEIPEKAIDLAKAFWPGPLTVIMKKGSVIPDEVSAGLDTVAVRIPSHPDAHKLLQVSGLALAAPSANTSGKPSPTTAAHVMNDMNGRIEAVLDGGSCSVGVESTVITLVPDVPRILRPGIITKEDIEAVIGEVEVDHAVLNQLEKDEKASSPGMKYKHYAPKAKVILVRGDDKKYVNLVNRAYSKDRGVAALCYNGDKDFIKAPSIPIGDKGDEKAQAQALFDALRAVDEIDGVTTVYARCPSANGIGMALYNRMIRAAAFTVIDLPTKHIVGLTGLTGAGKSEAARIFEKCGAYIVSADKAARAAVEDTQVLSKLQKAFGDILLPDGSLDRRKVASIAFSSKENTRLLNSVTHPKIAELMFADAESTDRDIVIFDASQLFEANEDLFCDEIVSVVADENTRIKRLSFRDGITEAELRQRMSAQLDEQFFISHSDYIIENNGNKGELSSKVRAVYERLVKG